MTLAEKLASLLEEIDEYEVLIDPDGSDFRILGWDTVAGILRNYGGKWKECNCGSSYCSICNGSFDPSIDVTFPDESKLHIGNPYQAAFTRFYIASKE